MTMTSPSMLKTLVLAAALAQPVAAAAQGARNVQPTPSARPSTPSSAPARTTPSISSRPAWTDQEYRLGSGDKLRIEVYGQPQLSQSLQIRPDGKITLPLVGDVPASGRTSIELRDALATSLKEYVNNPVVTVIVQEAVSSQITVMGEVTSPGPQVLSGPMTVLQALAQAGGFKEFANKSDIRVLRRTSTGMQTIEFNYKEAVKGRRDPLYLQPGDMVVIP